MNIHRLAVFCKVLELHSFTKAAEAVCLTQPTVSEHVRALEEVVGEKLVDRLGREALPTPVGKILYQYAKDIIRLRDEAVQAIEKFRGNLSGTLCIGASTIPGTYILPELIGDFKKMCPSIQITLKISDSTEVVDRIADGMVEFGVIGASWEDRRITLEEVFSDELVLAVYRGHPWEARKSVGIEELAEQPFILRERGSGTRMVMNQALDAIGFSTTRLNLVAEMGSTEAVRQGIKSRIGISILSRRAVSEDIEHGSLFLVSVEGLHLYRPFYLAQRKNRQPSPLCSAFLDYLRTQSRVKA